MMEDRGRRTEGGSKPSSPYFYSIFHLQSSILYPLSSILSILLLAGVGYAQTAEEAGKGGVMSVDSLIDKNLQALEREPAPAMTKKNEMKPAASPPAGRPEAGRRSASILNAKDPFIPPSFKETRGKEAKELVLKAVFYRDGGGVAIVNDRILRVGDVIEGKRLAAIHRDRVDLEDHDGKTTLVLGRFSTVR